MVMATMYLAVTINGLWSFTGAQATCFWRSVPITTITSDSILRPYRLLRVANWPGVIHGGIYGVSTMDISSNGTQKKRD